MAKSPSRYRQSPTSEWMLMLVLSLLVGGIIVSGMLHYTLLLAVLSAIFVGFFSWLWWSRRQAETPVAPAARRKSTPGKPKTRRVPVAAKKSQR